MSDPVTNIEIEDVLSSIRRLVSDGDKARTHNDGPIQVSQNVTPQPSESSSEEVSALPGSGLSSSDAQKSRPEKLILTPAFLVVDGTNKHDTKSYDTKPEAEDSFDADDLDGPLPLTEMVQKSLLSGIRETQSREAQKTDRSNLVATIAELEAAVSAGRDDFELDGIEEMSEAITWPASRSKGGIKQAQTKLEQVSDEDTNTERQDTTDSTSQDATDIYADDDLDKLLETEGGNLDEGALRALVADVVREELNGALGERMTRNVRKLVRREIYRILSSEELD